MNISNKVNVYLNFPGTCEEAFNYYRSIFGGEFSNISRFNEVPADVDFNYPVEYAHNIMHVALPISNETFLLGSDVIESIHGEFILGNNFSVSIAPSSLLETKRIFEALSLDGTIVNPLSETFWGSTFGVVTDKWGISWTINFEHVNNNVILNEVIETPVSELV